MSSRRRLQSGLPTWRKSAYLLRYLLGPSFLEGSVSAASRLIYFLFLRTTITCGEETPSDFDRNSGDWSGSKFCNDRCLVARKAQLIKGITDGIEAVLKFLCLPMLGVISDLNGRNTIMAVSLIGLASSLAILSTAAYLKKGTPIFPLCILAYVIQGVTESFTLGSNANISDIVRTTRERGHAFGLIEVFRLFSQGFAIVIVTAAFISANSYNYFPLYLALCVLAGMTVPLPHLTIPESNIDDRDQEVIDEEENNHLLSSRISPFGVFNVFTPYLTVLGLLVFFVIFGVAVLTISPAFVIGAYRWTQTLAVLVAIAIGTFGFLATVCAPRLIGAFGARKVLRGAVITANIGSVVLVLSPLHEAFFILGALLCVIAIIGFPAFNALVSGKVEKDQVGKMLGAFSSIGIAAYAIGSPVYSAIFSAVGSGGDCGSDTVLSLVWLPWGLAAVSMSIASFILYRFTQTFPESEDDVQEIGASATGNKLNNNEKKSINNSLAEAKMSNDLLKRPANLEDVEMRVLHGEARKNTSPVMKAEK